MNWKIEFEDKVDKQFDNLDPTIRKRIDKFINERLLTSINPRILATQLKGDLSGLWRYRVGDYRLICEIEDNIVTILVISVGHRKEVYN